MLVMLVNYSPVKKIITAFLPFCFLWLFAACGSFCADKGTENYQHYTVSATTADASTSDSCPITNAPDVVFNEHTAFDFQIPAIVSCRIFPVDASTFVVADISHRRGKPPFAEPPLKRLPVLRI